MKNAPYVVAAIAILASFPIFAASPGPGSVTAARTVPVGDLDLSAPKDRAILDRRIHATASAICKALNGDQPAAIARCVTRGVQGARAQRDAQVERHVIRAMAIEATAFDAVG